MAINVQYSLLTDVLDLHFVFFTLFAFDKGRFAVNGGNTTYKI